MSSLSLFFGAKRKKRSSRVRKSPGRKPRGGGVKKLSKAQSYISVAGRKRKLYLGHNGGLFYRTKSGRHYVPKAVLRRKGHLLSPKKRKAKKALKKRRKRKLKQSKAAKKARAAYRKRKARRSRFGLW